MACKPAGRADCTRCSCRSETAHEHFQFGPGEPVLSRTRRTHDVGVLGVSTQLPVYELDSVSEAIDQVPGLIGPDELAVWRGRMDFTDKSVEVFGRRGGIVYDASAHPCLSLLEFPGGNPQEEVVNPHEPVQGLVESGNVCRRRATH